MSTKIEVSKVIDSSLLSGLPAKSHIREVKTKTQNSSAETNEFQRALERAMNGKH